MPYNISTRIASNIPVRLHINSVAQPILYIAVNLISY